jgi:hypothetical protein
MQVKIYRLLKRPGMKRCFVLEYIFIPDTDFWNLLTSFALKLLYFKLKSIVADLPGKIVTAYLVESHITRAKHFVIP